MYVCVDTYHTEHLFMHMHTQLERDKAEPARCVRRWRSGVLNLQSDLCSMRTESCYRNLAVHPTSTYESAPTSYCINGRQTYLKLSQRSSHHGSQRQRRKHQKSGGQREESRSSGPESSNCRRPKRSCQQQRLATRIKGYQQSVRRSHNR